MSELSKVWNAFNVVYCLNQRSRPDRWKQATQEFQRVGLQAKQFLSIRAQGAHQSFCLSQYAMLRSFLETGKQTLMALEDDVIFDELEVLEAAVAELPVNWDVLYLGANITDMVFGIEENRPVRYSEHLHRVRRAWTSHAIAYRRPIVEKIVNLYPVETFEMYDCWLSNNVLANCKAFLVNPMVAFQRKGRSDIWGQETDYTGAFEWGNKYMKI